MKKTVLFFLLLVTSASVAQAQSCEPDSSLLQTGEIISPAFWSPSNPVIATTPACIGEPYSMSVTFNIPDTITVPGPGGTPITAPLDSIRVAQMGAIANLPTGLSYVCDPPSCTFKKNTLGCVLVFGTPTSANAAPDTVDLAINITAYSPAFFGFPIPLTLPQQLADSFHYYLEVRPAGMCDVGVNTLGDQIASIKNAPNPFSGQTLITVDAITGGAFTFEVFDLLGQRVYADNVRLAPGRNDMTFDAGYIADGLYYYAFSNAQGRVAKTMVVSRR